MDANALKETIETLHETEGWDELSPLEKSEVHLALYQNAYLPLDEEENVYFNEVLSEKGERDEEYGLTPAQWERFDQYLGVIAENVPTAATIKAGAYEDKLSDFLFENERTEEGRVIDVIRPLWSPPKEKDVEYIKQLDFGTLPTEKLMDYGVTDSIKGSAPERYNEFVLEKRKRLFDSGAYSRGKGPEQSELEMAPDGRPVLKNRDMTTRMFSVGPGAPGVAMPNDPMQPSELAFKNSAFGWMRDFTLQQGIKLTDIPEEERERKLVDFVDRFGGTYLTREETELMRQSYPTLAAEFGGMLVPGVAAAKVPGALGKVIEKVARAKRLGIFGKGAVGVTKLMDKFGTKVATNSSMSRSKRFAKRLLANMPMAVLGDAPLAAAMAVEGDYPAVLDELLPEDAEFRATMQSIGLGPETVQWAALEGMGLSMGIQSLLSGTAALVGKGTDMSAAAAMRRNDDIAEVVAGLKERFPNMPDAEIKKMVRPLAQRDTRRKLTEIVERKKDSIRVSGPDMDMPSTKVAVEDPNFVLKGKGKTTDMTGELPEMKNLEEAQQQVLARRRAKADGGTGAPPASSTPPVPPKPKPKPKVEVKAKPKKERITSDDRYRGLGKGHEHFDMQLEALEKKGRMMPVSRVFLREVMRDVDDRFLHAFSIDTLDEADFGILVSGLSKDINSSKILTPRSFYPMDMDGAIAGVVGKGPLPGEPPFHFGPNITFTDKAKYFQEMAAKRRTAIGTLNAQDMAYVGWHETGHVLHDWLLDEEEYIGLLKWFGGLTEEKAEALRAGLFSAHEAGGRVAENEIDRINSIFDLPEDRVPDLGQAHELFAELFALRMTGRAVEVSALDNMLEKAAKKTRNALRAILKRDETQGMFDEVIDVGGEDVTIGELFEMALSPRDPAWFARMEAFYGKEVGKDMAARFRTELRKIPRNEDMEIVLGSRGLASMLLDDNKGKFNMDFNFDPDGNISITMLDEPTQTEIHVGHDGKTEVFDITSGETMTADEYANRVDKLFDGSDATEITGDNIDELLDNLDKELEMGAADGVDDVTDVNAPASSSEPKASDFDPRPKAGKPPPSKNKGETGQAPASAPAPKDAKPKPTPKKKVTAAEAQKKGKPTTKRQELDQIGDTIRNQVESTRTLVRAAEKAGTITPQQARRMLTRIGKNLELPANASAAKTTAVAKRLETIGAEVDDLVKGKAPKGKATNTPSANRSKKIRKKGKGYAIMVGERVTLKDGTKADVTYLPSDVGRSDDATQLMVIVDGEPRLISVDDIKSADGFPETPTPQTLGDPNLKVAEEGVTLPQWTVGNRTAIHLDEYQVTLLNQLHAGYVARLKEADKIFKGHRNAFTRGKKKVRYLDNETLNQLKLFELQEEHERMMQMVIDVPEFAQSPRWQAKELVRVMKTTTGTITSSGRARALVRMLNATLDAVPQDLAQRVYRELFDGIRANRPAGMETPGNAEVYLTTAIQYLKGKRGERARATLGGARANRRLIDTWEDELFEDVGIQEGIPEAGIDDIHLFNVVTDRFEDMGVVRGSTVSEQTLKKLGYGIRNGKVRPFDAFPAPTGGRSPMNAEDQGFVDAAGDIVAGLLVRDGYANTVARSGVSVPHLGDTEAVNRALIDVLSMELDNMDVPFPDEVIERAMSKLDQWVSDGKIPVGDIPQGSLIHNANDLADTLHELENPAREAVRRDARAALQGEMRDPANLEPVQASSVKAGDVVTISGRDWFIEQASAKRIKASSPDGGTIYASPSDIIMKDRDIPVNPTRINIDGEDVDIGGIFDPKVAPRDLNPVQRSLIIAAKATATAAAKTAEGVKGVVDKTRYTSVGAEAWALVNTAANAPLVNALGIKARSLKAIVTHSAADWFLSRGFLPAEFYDPNVVRRSKIKREEWISLQIAKDFTRESRKYAKAQGLDALDQGTLDALNAFISPKPANKDSLVKRFYAIPQPLRRTAVDMRQHQTRLSREMIKEGVTGNGLSLIVGKNELTYWHTSYAMFEDETFRSRLKNLYQAEPNNPVFRDLKELIRQAQIKAGNDPYNEAADEMIDGWIASLLNLNESDVATGNVGFHEMISQAGPAGGNNVRLNPDIFFKKHEQPLELRKLLGEYGMNESFETAYLNSIMKSSKFLANHAYLNNIRDVGIAKGIFRVSAEGTPAAQRMQKAGLSHAGSAFVKRRTGEAWTHAIVEETDLGLGPLEGLVTNENIARSLRRMLGLSHKGGQHGWQNLVIDPIVMANSWAKMMATVGNAMTHVRNYLGNMEFMVSNGYLADMATKPFFAGESARKAGGAVLRNISGSNEKMVRFAQTIGGMSDDEWKFMYEELIELGVIGEGTFAREIKELYTDFSRHSARYRQSKMAVAFGDTFDRIGLAKFRKAMKKGGRATVGKAFEAYQAGDDFWRILAFQLETDRLNNAMLGTAHPDGGTWTGHLIRKEAADRIRATMPTYSEVPRFIQGMRHVPFIAPFVSFWWESFRTRANSFKYAFQDMTSANVQMQRLGANRLVGLLTVPAAYQALEWVGQMVDPEIDSAEKSESLRYFLGPWSRHANIVGLNSPVLDKFLGKRKPGELRSMDLSYMFPVEFLMDPARILMSGTPDGDNRVLAAAFAMFEPLLGEELFAKKVREAVSGGVWVDGLDLGDNLQNVFMHFAEPIVPGTAKSVYRIGKGAMDPRAGDSRYGTRYIPQVELAAMTTGTRATTTSLENSLFFRMRDSNELVSTTPNRILGKISYSGQSVDKEKVLSSYDKAVKSAYRGWVEAHVGIQHARTLDLPDHVIKRSLRSAGFKPKQINALLMESPVFMPPTLDGKDFIDRMDRGDYYHPDIRSEVIAIQNKWRDLPVNVISEEIRSRHE